MKKVIAVICAFALVACMFAGCGAKKTETSDLEYVKEKGTLVVGITEFEPMDYKQSGSDEWVGFDADMARAFAKSFGVDVKFVLIDWDNKALELSDKKIDCAWNGMTLTDEVKSSMDCTKAYCNNGQVVIVNKDVADKYNTVEACKDLKFAVEAGSAGEKAAKENGFNITSVSDQASALLEVKSGTCDAAVIDRLMAAAMVGEGTNYANLTYTVNLCDEEYGIGFRKGSDLVEKANEFLAASAADGTMEKIAEQYGVQASIIK